MAKLKITDAEFWEKAGPLLANSEKPPTVREIAKAVGLTEGGTYSRLYRMGIKQRKRWNLPSAA
jgi:hypothetical protein